MLIQMPRGSHDLPGAQNAEECSAFEAALRRDLATAPVVSYDAVLGGLAKRIFDIALTLTTAPVWLPVMLVTAAQAKLRHPSQVLRAEERVGYGGRTFKCFSMRIDPPTAKIERLAVGGPAPANDLSSIANHAEGREAKWRRALERLPRLFNVLAGDMSLVGPSPLSQAELDPLKTAKRYYLSARPGVVGVAAVADASEEEASQYKVYALSWSISTDALLLWDALVSLRKRGELWKPSVALKSRAKAAERVVVRRRNVSATPEA